ncbi:MAG TPA: ribosome-associated translation inhibitor RaiA [Candidatus Faecisoma merdavium]|nr:ribosome-associated translation inhibitor RaiA [Candidatus Faecisoma merdavium]
MKFNIRGSKVKITSAINDYIEAKIGKLDKYLENPDEITANVVVRVKGNDQTVEVTIPMKKIILRAEDTHNDLYAAVDLVSDKLERQIRKNKTRIKKRVKDITDINVNFKVEKDEDEKGKIVKRKLIETKPMNEEEAILQMNLLGHDFFVFTNDDTNQINILYRRKDSNYGIIETK